jgi:hypothetical protein
MHRINVRPERVDLQLSRVELRKPLLGADLPLPEGEEEPSKVITLEIPVRLSATSFAIPFIALTMAGSRALSDSPFFSSSHCADHEMRQFGA